VKYYNNAKKSPSGVCRSAIYHLMDRGDRLEEIYREKRDREIFLQTLGEVCERCGWQVHAYVLMGNHYHLLLETPEANLSRGMRLLQGIYTIRHNACDYALQHLRAWYPLSSNKPSRLRNTFRVPLQEKPFSGLCDVIASRSRDPALAGRSRPQSCGSFRAKPRVDFELFRSGKCQYARPDPLSLRPDH